MYHHADVVPARRRCRRCLEHLVAGLDHSVVSLVLDSRGAHRDVGDRRVLRHVLRSIDRADSVSYAHRGSRDEPLLGLPDAVGWSVGTGGHFAKNVAGRVQPVFLRAAG